MKTTTINNKKTQTGLLATILLLFGTIYAYYIALKPFHPRRTWLSVVIGDAATDIGSFLFIYLWTKNPLLAIIPFISHILTGSPMIIGQILKHRFFDLDNKRKIELYQNGNGKSYQQESRKLS